MRVSMILLVPLLLGGCATLEPADPVALAPPLAVEPAAGPPMAAVEANGSTWPAAVSCAALARALAAMAPAAAARLDPAQSPLALASLAPPGLEVQPDLPIPEVAADGLAEVPCAILVGSPVALTPAADQVVDRQIVASVYQTGTKRRRNPEHQQLEKALAAARRGGSGGSDILKTGDPLLDLIGTVTGGIIDGIGAIKAKREIRALEARLAETPPFIVDPILTPYRFELTEVEAERAIALPLALHDWNAGLAWQMDVTITERRRFALADGRHATDPQALPASAAPLTAPTDLEAWRRAPPPLTTGTVLHHLAARLATSPEPQAVSRAAIIMALRTAAPGRMAGRDKLPGTPEPAAGPLGRFAGDVPAGHGSGTGRLFDGQLVEVGGERLAGFYVTSEHIVAPVEALGHSSLITVRYPDGMRGHGLVEVVDDSLGLALIYLPRSGEPLPRGSDASPPPTETIPPGTPWARDGRVSGVFTGDPLAGGRRWVDAIDLDRLVARLVTL